MYIIFARLRHYSLGLSVLYFYVVEQPQLKALRMISDLAPES